MTIKINSNEWENSAKLVSELLETNVEWKDRFSEYAKEITDRMEKIKGMRKCFNQRKPLYVYSRIGAVKDAKIKHKGKIVYDLRFHGQSVATIEVENEEVYLSETEEQHKKAEDYFGFKYAKLPTKTPWAGSEAAEFRKSFRELDLDPQGKNQPGKSREHFLESKLLDEFNKKKRAEGKSLVNIQPVRLAGAYFQMPTPLAASGVIDYEKKAGAGGGIDILARIKYTGKSNLCIMELKDENKKEEPPEKVMQQAVAYAVFIAHLLRNTARNSGNKWYKLFGFGENVPRELDLMAIAVMPGKGTDFEKEVWLEELKTTIMLRSLYFEETDKAGFAFSGSLQRMLATK